MYFLTLELTGQRWFSLLAMLVLASTQFFSEKRGSCHDRRALHIFSTLVIFFYLKGLKNNVYQFLLGLPTGLALLTRSVIGFLAIAIVVVHLVFTKRRKVLWSPWFISGLALALAIPSIWYISQYRLHGAASFAAHFRFVMDKIHAESGATRWLTIFNYPEALLKYYWPWLPFLSRGCGWKSGLG